MSDLPNDPGSGPIPVRPRIRIRRVEASDAMRITADDAPKMREREGNATSWKPGQSGNPKGRPKGAKGVKAIVRKVFSEKVEVTPTKKMQLFEALLRQEAQSAAKGDWRARATMFSLARWFLGADVDVDVVLANEADLTPASRSILAMYTDEIRRGDDVGGGKS